MKSEKSSLLHKILYSNMRILGFFGMLTWLYFTGSVCYSTYHQTITQQKAQLADYTEYVKETLNLAIVRSEHIIRSSYLSAGLKKEDYSIVEMLEFYDVAEDILYSAEEVNGYVRIYTTNPHLHESRLFSQVNMLSDYDRMMAEFHKGNSLVLYENNPTQIIGTLRINIYREMPQNPGCILEYPVNFEIRTTPNGFPLSVVSSTDPILADNTYLTQPANDNLTCVVLLDKQTLLRRCITTFGLCVLGLILLAAAVIHLSRITTKKTIQEINDFIEKLTGEDLISNGEFFRTVYGLEELNIIKQTLQHLSTEIQCYTKAIRAAEQENKQLEMERLTMQLDPHMLYNSLASIRLNAFRIKNQKILDLVDNMALYYREVLRKDRKAICVRDEIETIRKYLFINELSHEKRYRLETQIDPSLLQMMIPPQFLHTFVENCIVHGLSGAREDCVIRIEMHEANGIVTLSIYDNGYGMTPETLWKMNAGEFDAHHIGIANSKRRMELAFGEDSSIRFESEKNRYTKVILRFQKPPYTEE